MFFSQSPYDPSHTPPTFSYCSSLFSLRCSQNTPLCFTTPNILSAMLIFRLTVTFLSPGQFFSSKTHGGPHCAHISPLPTAYPTPVILSPPHSLPSSSIPFSLSPSGSRRGERWAGGAPQRATRRRRWGALRPQASGAAACSEDLHRCRVMPAAADVPLIPRLLREHTCLTSLGIATGNKR